MKKTRVYLPLSNKKDIVPILNKISIFGALNNKQLQGVLKLLTKTLYSANEYIFKEGSDPSHIYIIESGKVKMVLGVDKTPLEIFQFESGQCFGETSVIGIQPHSASAIAVTNTELIVLSRKALFSIFESDKKLFGILILNIAREACRRLYATDQILLHYVLKNKK